MGLAAIPKSGGTAATVRAAENNLLRVADHVWQKARFCSARQLIVANDDHLAAPVGRKSL
jgi:hypothetical protein